MMMGAFGRTPQGRFPETPIDGGYRAAIPRNFSETLFASELDNGAQQEVDELSEEEEDDFSSAKSLVPLDGHNVTVRVFGPERTILRQKIGQMILKDYCTHEIRSGANYIDFLVEEDSVERLTSQNNQLVEGYIIGVQRLNQSRVLSGFGRKSMRSGSSQLSSSSSSSSSSSFSSPSFSRNHIFCSQPEGIRINLSFWDKILHYIF
eukprot:TRINITY_DN3255_c0_g1_i1.p1 TRINITY_DN3255_c0_g1~~TRINITY_DN3255_c0_g1_i1.p1  ORF type:complete len:232 (-),score=80.58 TRINITY_DN3255_c0_g1_i1:96-713(-)